MYIKGLFETFRILGRLGIKPKDVIGMGGDVVKMGKSLFNTRVNPKLLQFVEKNGKIPTKIIEQIKIHARTLKNASENQKKLFEVNIRDILNAKTPKSPVSSVQRPATSVKEQVTADAFKGWTPKVIKGGKDGLATGGRAGFDGGGSPLQQLKQEIVDSMKPYAPGVPEDQLQIIVKDITFDMSPAEAQASAKANFIKLFGMATGGIANHFRKR